MHNGVSLQIDKEGSFKDKGGVNDIKEVTEVAQVSLGFCNYSPLREAHMSDEIKYDYTAMELVLQRTINVKKK